MDAKDRTLPSALMELIQQERWPTADAPWNDQDARPRIAGEVVEAIAPGEQHVCLAQYPFHTVGDEIRRGNTFFEGEMTAPAEIAPDLALIIADFGLGSDAPIVLDYRTDPPRVLRLAWHSIAAPPGSDQEFVMDNHWVVMAETVEDLVERLGL